MKATDITPRTAGGEIARPPQEAPTPEKPRHSRALTIGVVAAAAALVAIAIFAVAARNSGRRAASWS